ncbi:MAG: NgoMIV family type II restriction endonuclease [bacterium]
MPSVLEKSRRSFFKELSARNLLTFDDYNSQKSAIHAVSNADFSNRASVAISNSVARKIGVVKKCKKLPGQSQGDLFEELVCGFIRETFCSLSHIRPGQWNVQRITARDESAIWLFDQYRHLADLARFCSENRELASALGNDYAISPDVVISRSPEKDDRINEQHNFLGGGLAARTPLREVVNPHPILHACISCKFTFRSDRAQNARSEALNLIRNRKGRIPHLVIVTAECLPSRLASVALGTGDIDCVYHIALPELIESVDKDEFPDAYEMLQTIVGGRRLRDLSDLPLDLAI